MELQDAAKEEAVQDRDLRILQLHSSETLYPKLPLEHWSERDINTIVVGYLIGSGDRTLDSEGSEEADSCSGEGVGR